MPVGIVLINDGCGRPQPSVGSAILQQVVLGDIRTQTEQAMENCHKQCFSMVSASVLTSRFLPWFPPMMTCNLEIKQTPRCIWSRELS